MDGNYIFGFCVIVVGFAFMAGCAIKKFIDFANDASLD